MANSARKIKDIYGEFTKKFLASMDEGTSIYHQPWKAVLPVSNGTGKAYLNMNAINLMCKSISEDFDSDRWIFVQSRPKKTTNELIKDRYDIDVKDGEDRSMVMFFSIVEIPVKTELLDEENNLVIDTRTNKPVMRNVRIMKTKRDEHGRPEKDDKGNDIQEEADEVSTRFIPREYFGYNLSQCDNVPEKMLHPIQRPNVAFGDVVAGMLTQIGCTVKEGNRNAGVDTDNMVINMPNKASFEDPEMYNVVLFQQMINATAVKGNLDRLPDPETLDSYAGTVYDQESKAYAEEKFAGSLGAVIMSALLDDVAIGNQKVFEQQAAQMKEWRFLMEKDPGFLVRSSRIAQRSINFLISNIPELNQAYKVKEDYKEKLVKKPQKTQSSPKP